VPEVAATFNTDGSIINVSNALYMLFMGISPLFYGPYGNIYGRKWVGNRGCIGIFLRLMFLSGLSRKRSAIHCLLYWNRFSA
jgi:MFS family permease